MDDRMVVQLDVASLRQLVREEVTAALEDHSGPVEHVPDRNPKAYVTTAQAAAEFGISRQSVRRLVHQGVLRAIRHRESGASPLLIPRSEMDRYRSALEGSA